MKYGEVELYNIVELLSGTGAAMLPEAARAHIAEGQPVGGLGAWSDIEDNGSWLCRVPETVRRALNGPAQINAIQSTGGEVRFCLPADGGAKIVLNMVQTPAVAEVWAGSFFREWVMVGLENTTIVVKPPENIDELAVAANMLEAPWHPSLVRVRLPWRPPCRLVSIEGDMLPASGDLAPSIRYLAYGSSITHGNASIRPSSMYASRIAQRLGADLINLGFGGGAHLEEEIAGDIASRSDWDFGTFELGINLINGIDADEFARRVDRFVDIVVATHSDKRLYFIDLFTCKFDYGEPEMQRKIHAFRSIVQKKVESVGLSNVVHLDGRALLSGSSCLAADLVHPSPAGMETIAERLAARISADLGYSPNVAATSFS
jgi:hypothetical protein